jgi:hypothetical protein
VWFEPQWYLEPETFETISAYLIEYNDGGHEIARRSIPVRPGDSHRRDPRMLNFEPTQFISFSGLVTSPVEFSLLSAAKQYLVGDVRRKNGREVLPVISFLFFSTQFYLPSFGYVPRTPAELTFGFASLMFVSSAISGLICFLLSRRYACARMACIGWAVCGLLAGPSGLLLLLAVQEWPARIECPKCHRLRVVTRESCEHCGAAHAVPVPDGTEIFERTIAIPQPAIAIRRGSRRACTGWDRDT